MKTNKILQHGRIATLFFSFTLLASIPTITVGKGNSANLNQSATETKKTVKNYGLDVARMENQINAVFDSEIQSGNIPGGVVTIVRGDNIVFEKAYGNRSLKPQVEPTELDTIYDMASVTKPVATGTAMMVLLQEGKVRLNDKVSDYLESWKKIESNDKETTGPKHSDITVRHLLTHTSGLASFINFNVKYPDGTNLNQVVKDIAATPLRALPGEKVIYSDLGYITLGAIIEKVSGMPLNEFTEKNVFKPLGMEDTFYIPPTKVSARIAPTGLRIPRGQSEKQMIRGEVHDPNSYALNGVTGHAGLFSTGRDMAKYAISLINKDNKVLSPLTINTMTTDHARLTEGTKRGLGWDIESGYSSLRGDIFKTGFGHTGFTGTSIWVVPEEKIAIIILTNRVHPDDQGNSTPVRAKVANIVAGCITESYVGK